ncbi:2-dehydropantoate 2-reductase [hydrothermal vent metagenome]|uniref:2-dehydropantoate 2-reductase n=1 Tax=hydrothermal vent metagenome TaxID=652676 RepID=A0A1W1D2Z8_9ZZZZ
MKIAIIGLGGVGGYLLASLTKTNHEVIGFARNNHLQAIQQNGLTIIEDTKTYTLNVKATTLQEAQGHFDIVLFCVKSYDIVPAYEAIKTHIDKNSILVSFANGIAPSETLKKISQSVVLDGAIYILSHIEKPGVIRKKGKVFAAVFGNAQPQTSILEKIFQEANLRTKTPQDIQTAIWKKFIFISAFASLTSYYDKSIGYIYEYHKEEAKQLLCEISDVAKAKGIDISDEIEKSLLTAQKVPYDSSTSMHLDFQKERQTELQTLSYYIIEEGKKHNIPTPLMEKIYNKLAS